MGYGWPEVVQPLGEGDGPPAGRVGSEVLGCSGVSGQQRGVRGAWVRARMKETQGEAGMRGGRNVEGSGFFN